MRVERGKRSHSSVQSALSERIERVRIDQFRQPVEVDQRDQAVMRVPFAFGKIVVEAAELFACRVECVKSSQVTSVRLTSMIAASVTPGFEPAP